MAELYNPHTQQNCLLILSKKLASCWLAHSLFLESLITLSGDAYCQFVCLLGKSFYSQMRHKAFSSSLSIWIGYLL